MWWIAIIMGLTGSLHCLGMCSPLAMVVTSHRPFVVHKAVYNTGRIGIYGLLGILAAYMGSFALVTPYQNLISNIMGAVFLLIGIGAIKTASIPVFSKLMSRLTISLKSCFGRWLYQKSTGSVFILGMLNGLLPCGLTYLALAYCFSFSSWVDGFLFMIIFGLGTWPVMLGFPYILNWITRKMNLKIGTLHTCGFLLAGILLLSRGALTDKHLHNAETISNEVTNCR